MILCPHCEEPSCDGKCRFRVGRRGFLGLGLGALAVAVLPPIVVPTLQEVVAVTEPLGGGVTMAVLAEWLKKTYPPSYFKPFETEEMIAWR